jgi:hypothetical protein
VVEDEESGKEEGEEKEPEVVRMGRCFEEEEVFRFLGEWLLVLIKGLRMEAVEGDFLRVGEELDEWSEGVEEEVDKPEVEAEFNLRQKSGGERR